jgi:hypothetical protein
LNESDHSLIHHAAPNNGMHPKESSFLTPSFSRDESVTATAAETEHFCQLQKKVAKIVHCGEPEILDEVEEEATRDGGLKFFVA